MTSNEQMKRMFNLLYENLGDCLKQPPIFTESYFGFFAERQKNTGCTIPATNMMKLGFVEKYKDRCVSCFTSKAGNGIGINFLFQVDPNLHFTSTCSYDKEEDELIFSVTMQSFGSIKGAMDFIKENKEYYVKHKEQDKAGFELK